MRNVLERARLGEPLRSLQMLREIAGLGLGWELEEQMRMTSWKEMALRHCWIMHGGRGRLVWGRCNREVAWGS